jgi:hypothetical protein
MGKGYKLGRKHANAHGRNAFMGTEALLIQALTLCPKGRKGKRHRRWCGGYMLGYAVGSGEART